MRKICLIHPPTPGCTGLGASLGGREHIGLGYVSSFLQEAGYSVDILNVEGDFLSPHEAAEEVSQLCPVWAGVSPTSLSVGWAIEFGDCLRDLGTTPLVFGGHLATHMGETFLENVQSADVVVVGDGELPSLALTKALETNALSGLQDVPGIVYRMSGQILRSRVTKAPQRLDELPWPARPHIGEERRVKSARVLTSRGCPHNCSFCTTPGFYNRSVRYRSMNDVVKEILWLCNNGARHFTMNDDMFFDNSPRSLERVQEFIALVSETIPGISIRPSCRADVLLENPQLLSDLKRVGMHCCFVGLESASAEDLDYFNKGLSPSQNVAVVELCRQLGISLMPGFIMFSGASTLQSIRRNLGFLYKMDLLYRSTLICRTVLGFPGTDLFKQMHDTGSYDVERSSVFLAYPKFRDVRVRELSVAMQEVEALFSSVDSRMLHNRIQVFDRRNPPGQGEASDLAEPRYMLDEIAAGYYRTLMKAVEMAGRSISSDRILSLFSRLLPAIEARTEEFENALGTVYRR